MIFIINNTTLLAQVPNVELTVEGEATLFDKVKPWLTMAEQWTVNTFLGNSLAQTIAANTTTTIWQQVAGLIVAEAMRQAIPELDLVLTPNGFGIVSNQNVAPASKERVERLINAMTAKRDYCIEMLLDNLHGNADWQDTPQRAWFCQTLLQTPKVCIDCVEDHHFDGDRWTRFLTLREKAMIVESKLAEKWLGNALLQRLRLQLNAPGASVDAVQLAIHVRQCVFGALKGWPVDYKTMNRVVNFVRTRPEEYPEWAASDTAKLFDPPVFRNKKDSSGYFF